MSNSKFFSVIVGGAAHKPAQVEVGFLDEDGKPKGDTITAYVEKAGTAVPNYSEIWGIQEKGKDGVITGGIKPLKWDHPDGYLIKLRHLRTSQSLDMEYQDLKKMRVLDEEAEIALSLGVNNFDRVKDKMLIKMLELHYQNEANESRDPSRPVAFTTYDPDKITKLKVTDVENRQKAERIVMDANNSGKAQALEILASMFDIEPRQQQDVLFAELMDLTPTFDHFLRVLDLSRTQYKEVLDKSVEIGLIDVEPKDAIYLIKDGNKELLLEDIGNGKDNKLPYVLENFYQVKFFNALEVLKEAYKKFAEKQLQ
jgi:hypothetical protein